MKSTLYLLCYLLSFPAKAQEPGLGKIKLLTADSRTGDWYPYYGGRKINLYKLPENEIAFRINTWDYRESLIVLDSIPVSEYKLVYMNMHHQEIKKTFQVNAGHVNHISLTPDSLLSYPQNTLAKLKNGDTIAISFRSHGCFNFDVQKLIIKKDGERFVAVFYNLARFTSSNLKRKSRHSVILTKENINDFIRFENELNYAKEGGCTTTDEYEIKSRDLDIKKTDGACMWNGFYYLKKALFGKINY